MEKRFQIVTDSSCDLPQALADELDLAVLPLHVLIGEHTYANYLDGREIGFKEFYDKLRNGERATTSAVNVSEFTAVMEGKLKEGLDILFIGFSSGLSTTYQSGAIACDELREKYPERKLIAIDSLCASLGEGLLLYLAAKKQQSGASMDEVADYVRETIPHLCHWFTVNDLMFLKRGGRVDAATAIVGTVLQIKPVMHTDDAGTLKNVSHRFISLVSGRHEALGFSGRPHGIRREETPADRRIDADPHGFPHGIFGKLQPAARKAQLCLRVNESVEGDGREEMVFGQLRGMLQRRAGTRIQKIERNRRDFEFAKRKGQINAVFRCLTHAEESARADLESCRLSGANGLHFILPGV